MPSEFFFKDKHPGAWLIVGRNLRLVLLVSSGGFQQGASFIWLQA
jgi:hypothetical protein